MKSDDRSGPSAPSPQFGQQALGLVRSGASKPTHLQTYQLAPPDVASSNIQNPSIHQGAGHAPAEAPPEDQI
jgi:hypothetical protein